MLEEAKEDRGILFGQDKELMETDAGMAAKPRDPDATPIPFDAESSELISSSA